MPVRFEHSLPSGECENTGSDAGAPTWQHSRHTVFLVCLCILTGLTVMIIIRPGSAAEAAQPATPVSAAVSLADSAAVAPNPGAPTVTSLSPSSVSAGGGATVQITGTGFSSASAVYFGTNASSDFSVVSPDVITATAPTNSGSVNVAVVTPSGTSADNQASQITYAPTGQLPITVSGQNLETGGVPTKFTGVNAYELATSWGTNAG